MSPDRRGRERLAGRFVAFVLLLGMAQAARGDAPLTTADIVRFLRVGISERTILTELNERGFAEPFDRACEAALREAGASQTLVVAVRRAAPVESVPAPAPASPPPHPAAKGPPILPPGASDQEPVFAVRTRTVRVPVSVLDKSGQPVLGLQGQDFRVSEDGKRQEVTLFSGERRPLRIALALDVSRSMENKIREVEQALVQFIDLLEPADEIMVITFNQRVHIVQDFTSNRERLGRVLDMLEPFGSTALYDAAFESIQRVAAGPAESKAVVLVTDGVDTSSAISFEELREFARRSEVPVFSIGLNSGPVEFFGRPGGSGTGGRRPPGGPGGGVPGGGWPGGGGRWPGGGGRGGWPGGGGGGGWPGGGGPNGGGHGMMTRAGFDARPLLDLADDTGGRAEILKDLHYTPESEGPGSDQLKAAVESIALTLRHRYLLGYEPPEGKSGWRTIRIDVDRPSATARARKGYYSAS